MGQKKDKIKVLNIAGASRSGSTILGNVLGEIKDFLFIGESLNIWTSVIRENKLCTCSKPFLECGFWNEIFDKAYGRMSNLDGSEMVNLVKEVILDKIKILYIFLPGFRKLFTSKLCFFLDNLIMLFNALKSVTNCKVIIDTSKPLIYSFSLSLLEDVDFYLFHLVRDPRGVAYSNQKMKRVPHTSKIEYMSKYSPLKSSLNWLIMNVLLEILGKQQKKYVVAFYEDFANNPKLFITQILKFLDEDEKLSPFVLDHRIKLTVNHSLSTNPSGFNRGLQEIKLDNEWKEKMNTLDKIVATLITSPMLFRYGYIMSDSSYRV